MIVFIPCAGLGTRLKPLTDHRPKALVEYQGKPLLAHLIERLQAQGFDRFVLNLHHFAPMLRDFATEYARRQGVQIAFSDESGCLLDTGGALTHARAAGLFAGEELVLVHNVDVFSDLDLRSFCAEFAAKSPAAENPADGKTAAENPAALLSVRRRPSSRYLYADAAGRLRAWRNEKTGQVKGEPISDDFNAFAFSGIHILKCSLIDEWAATYGTDTPFSVIDAYLDASQNHEILLKEQAGGFWKDMGKIEDFA